MASKDHKKSGGHSKRRVEKRSVSLATVATFLDDDPCAACGKLMSQVAGGRMVVQNNSFHRTCWVCTECKGPLPLDKVIQHPDSDLPVCKDCWTKRLAVACSRCAKVFQPGETVTKALDKRFHKDCFTCTKCNEGIAETEFVDVDGKPFHEHCA